MRDTRSGSENSGWHGYTSLCLAAAFGLADVATVLLDAGANIETEPHPLAVAKASTIADAEDQAQVIGVLEERIKSRRAAYEAYTQGQAKCREQLIGVLQPGDVLSGAEFDDLDDMTRVVNGNVASFVSVLIGHDFLVCAPIEQQRLKSKRASPAKITRERVAHM